MGSLLIRHVDDHLLQELKRRAAAEHRSVQQYVHAVLETVVRAPQLRERLDLVTVNTGRTEPMTRTEVVGEDERG